MEAVNGVSDGDKGGPPPPSPLTGCYLLIVIGEPHCNEHKDIILQRVAKGLLSWDVNDCLVDLEKELAIITEQALEGEEARYGERLIQFASENLVTEILIHPVVSTLAQCVRNLLSSFTRHRHIIHAGYTFANNGSWVLQDGTFSSIDFSEAFQEIEVLRVIRAYENGISLDVHCAPEGDWTRLPKEPFSKGCKVRVNPNDVLTTGSPSITSFINYLEPFLVPAELENILESSDVVGNIRFSRPTLYVFPGGQGDAALFGINGFNMLLDGGFSRKACFWDFVRHLDRLDAVLLTRLNNSNVNGISAVLKRKRQNALYPQIGHFFCNIQERKAILSPDGDKDKDPLLINLLDEGQDIVSNLRHLSLVPQVCYRDSEPINLYHKVGHGTLDMYVLSPAKDSKEVREFLQKWNNNDQKLFANQKTNKEFVFPLQNLVSICALLVWQPANPEDTITRILFPGSSPQNKIFEGLDKIKNLEFIKHPVCSEKSLAPAAIIKTKQSVVERIIQSEKKIPIDNKREKPQKPPPEVIDTEMKNGEVNGVQPEKGAPVKKSDSTESEKSISKPKKIIENEEKTEKSKPKPKSEFKPKPRSESQQRKVKTADKKPSPTTPKKQVEKMNGEPPKTKPKPSPSATPAKSAKEANNRKVVESKIKAAPKREPSKEPSKTVPEKKEAKTERKPISRRPKDISKLSASPSKKVNGVQKPDSITRRGKLDKEGTTDSSTVSTPSADQDSILKKDISKLTSEEIQNLKAQELADLKEEQEAVKEIEAVFRKGELHEDKPSDFRKIKDISIDDKLESEEYLIIEKTEIEQDLVNESNKEEETQKIARDSEESEKQRKLSEEKEIDEKPVEVQEETPKVTASTTEAVKPKEEIIEASKEPSVTSPEEKLDISTDKKDVEEIKEVAQESQPDEKGSANIESGATTTAPTLPEDERMPLDEIKEDNGDQIIEEKHVKEDTKEKDVPVIQLPPKTFDNVTKLPPVVGIRLDKQSHIRDIVKTPDEVADLPVHEEVEFGQYEEYPSGTETKSEVDEKKEDVKATEEVKKEDAKDEKLEKDKVDDTDKAKLVSDTKDEKPVIEKLEDSDKVKLVSDTKDEKTEKVIDKLVDIDKAVDKEKTDLGVKEEEIKKEVTQSEVTATPKETVEEVKTVISEDLNKKELSKSPDEEKDKDEHEQELKEEVKDVKAPSQLDEAKEDEAIKKEKEDVCEEEKIQSEEPIKVEEVKLPEVEEQKEPPKKEKEDESVKPGEKEDEKEAAKKETADESVKPEVEDEKEPVKKEKEDDSVKPGEPITESMKIEDVKSSSQPVEDKKESVEKEKEDESAKSGEPITESIKIEDIKLSSQPEEIKDKDVSSEKEKEDAVKIESAKSEEPATQIEDTKLPEPSKKEKEDVESKTKVEEVKEPIKDEELTKLEAQIVTDVPTEVKEVQEELDKRKESLTRDESKEEVIEKSETEVKEKDDGKDSKVEEKDKLEELKKQLPDVPKDEVVVEKTSAATSEQAPELINEQKLKEDVSTIQKIDQNLQKLKQETAEVDKSETKKGEDIIEDKKEETKVKEDLNTIEKVDEKLKEEETKTIEEVITHKTQEPQHAEPVVIKPDSLPDSPEVDEKKIELGRKSPKEREEDVAKIVASVAEVLKSDAPLEEFEGKIPFSIPYKTYTTELRETHITTVDSPVADESKAKTLEEQLCPKASSLYFIQEERKIAPIHEEQEAQETKISKMIKDSNDLMQATSRMIQDIKSTQQKTDTIIEEPLKEDQDGDSGTVHRMLVTASSEDGGEETEICPAGTITFSRSSESSGRSSPDLQSQKLSQKSSIADTFSDATVITKSIAKELQSSLEDSNKVAEDVAKVKDEKETADKESVKEDKHEVPGDLTKEVVEGPKAIEASLAKEEITSDVAKAEETKIEDSRKGEVTDTTTEKQVKDKKEVAEDLVKEEVKDTSKTVESEKDLKDVKETAKAADEDKDVSDVKELPEELGKDLAKMEPLDSNKQDVAKDLSKPAPSQEITTKIEPEKLKDTEPSPSKDIVDDSEKVEVKKQDIPEDLSKSAPSQESAKDPEKLTDTKELIDDAEKIEVVDKADETSKSVQEDKPPTKDIEQKDIVEVVEDIKKETIAPVEPAFKSQDATKPKATEDEEKSDEVKKTEEIGSTETKPDDKKETSIDVVKETLLKETDSALEAAKETIKKVEEEVEVKTDEVAKEVKQKRSFLGGLVNDIGTSLLNDTTKLIEEAQKKIEDIKDTTKSKIEEVKEDIAAKKEELSTTVEDLKDSLSKESSAAASSITDTVKEVIESAEVTSGKAKEAVKEEIGKVVEATDSKVAEVKQDITTGKEKLLEAAEDFGKTVVKDVDSIKDTVKSSVTDAKETVEDKAKEVKDTLTSQKEIVTDVISDVKESITTDVETKMEELKKEIVDSKEKAESEVKEVCKLASDKVDKQIEEVIKDVSQVSDKTKQTVDESIKTLEDTKDEILAKASEEIKDIGSKTESLLEGIKSQEEDMKKTIGEEIKEAEEKFDDKQEKVKEQLDDVSKDLTQTVTDSKDMAKSVIEEIPFVKKEVKYSEAVKADEAENKYDLYNGLESVEKMVVDVITADREESSKTDADKKPEQKELSTVVDKVEGEIESIVDKGVSEVKEFVEETKEAITSLFKGDKEDKEEVLEKAAHDIEENYEIVSDMTKSVVFEKCDKGTDEEKLEKQLEKSAQNLEKEYEALTDMAKSMVFETCDKPLTDEQKEERVLERAAHDIEENFEVLSDMTKSIVFDKCEAKEDEKLTDNVLDSKEVKAPSLTSIESEKDTSSSKKGSGKSSPELLDPKDISEDLACKLSGKSSPALSDIKDLPREGSGKSTPDIKEPDHIKIDNQDSLLSGKSSPGISGKSSPILSGRSTPGAKAESKDSLLSGKSTPDHTKPDSKESSMSGKSSPGLSSEIKVDDKEKASSLEKDSKCALSAKSTPVGSGKSSPAPVLMSEEAKSGKSTPDLQIKTDEKEKEASKVGLSDDGKAPKTVIEEVVECQLQKGPADVEKKDLKEDGKKPEGKESGDLSAKGPDIPVEGSAIPEKKTETDREKPVGEVLGTTLEVQPTSEKKLSISEISVKVPEGIEKSTSDLSKSDTPEETKVDDKTETRELDSIDSGIGTEVDSKAKKAEEMEKSVISETKEESVKTEAKQETLAGPSLQTPDTSLSPAKTSEDLHLSGKSTPDIADVEKMKEENLKQDKHIQGSSTPPTVPVSPIVKELSSTHAEDTKTAPLKSSTITTVKESDLRSCTPGSDDYEIGASTHSDISSGQVSRAPHLLESERIESDEEDDVPGSPMSVTSQVAHSRSSSRYDFEDERIGTKMDPMNTSFYGALPDDEEGELDFEKAMAQHRQARGEDLVTAEDSPSYLYEITKAKYSSKVTEPETISGQTQLDQINKNEASNLMTASFIGELPSAATSSETKQDPLESWGKPLGLPSPAPPNDNRGTPKKERKLPSNVSAKNKLNDDKKRSESPSKYRNKKFSPVYVDLTYVPHHGNAYYSYVDFFKRVRARYYVFSGIEPSREVYNALLDAKQTWEDKELEVTIIPTYDTDILGYWVAENEELLTKYKIDLSPSASRCTINLQDHETSCSAYRLEF